jgi:hypothetical protein
MTTRPYELLARFAPDGTVAGVSVRTITTVNGRDYESDPQPLSDTSDPEFVAFAEQFSADVVAERDLLKAELEALANLQAERDQLAAQVSDLQAEIEALKNPPSPQSITPRQAKLALYGAGLLDEVEAMVAQADRAVQIHYHESVTWLRNDPVLIGLAAQLGMTAEQLDKLFIQAATL